MKKTILIVDDDRAVANSLRKLMEAEKYNVFVASDTTEAIEHFRYQAVDLVILDINLGNESGWKVFHIMQEIKPSVPAIIVTAEFGQLDQAIAAGADALIEKPIDVSSFLDLIRDLLAEAPENTLQRLHRRPEYCRYIGKDYAAFLRLMHERYSAPLDLSAELSAALPGWRSRTKRNVPNPQSVAGDPTTMDAC